MNKNPLVAKGPRSLQQPSVGMISMIFDTKYAYEHNVTRTGTQTRFAPSNSDGFSRHSWVKVS